MNSNAPELHYSDHKAAVDALVALQARKETVSREINHAGFDAIVAKETDPEMIAWVEEDRTAAVLELAAEQRSLPDIDAAIASAEDRLKANLWDASEDFRRNPHDY